MYGHCETSVKELRLDPVRDRDIINEENRKGEKEVGIIKLNEFSTIEASSFVEYLKAGWYINLSVAIDFTASNKNHHQQLPNGELNDYELAIAEVGKILGPYAYREHVFGFGFGGIPHYHPDCKGAAMHDFALNGN